MPCHGRRSQLCTIMLLARSILPAPVQQVGDPTRCYAKRAREEDKERTLAKEEGLRGLYFFHGMSNKGVIGSD